MLDSLVEGSRSIPTLRVVVVVLFITTFIGRGSGRRRFDDRNRYVLPIFAISAVCVGYPYIRSSS